MTRKMILIATVAGMALSVPALAQKAERGGGHKAEKAQAERGGGQQAQRAEQPQRAERQVQRQERPQRIERQQQRAERQVERQERPQRIERQQQRAERKVERQERPQRIERQQQRVERQERPQRIERQQQRLERRVERQERPQRIDRKQQRVEREVGRQDRAQRIERQQSRVERRELIREARQDDRKQQRRENREVAQMFGSGGKDGRDLRAARFDGRGYRPVAPLSFTRDMRQMQSFDSKFDDRHSFSIGDRYVSNSYLAPVPTFFASNYVDTPDYYHRYDNDYGYVYRIDRDDGIVSSLMPLFGGYGIGDPWPRTYYSSYVPQGYRDYYYDTPDYYYRNDGYGIYQVDSGTQLITALLSLVMGQGYGVGQALPASYSAYNVPLDYRANYADSDDSWYRYGDGFIYQVDPASRQVAARYPLYSDDYYVGQPWPVAYPDYNVPYGYRSAYADTPQYQYRYANGGIYQVDPTNQLILALAALVSGDQFGVGQRMPAGYDIYNVPIDYRDRYADSDDQYYRYANGNVYRVDYGSGLIEESYPIYG